MNCYCCDAPPTEETLYECTSKECKFGKNVYCKRCGDAVHNRMNHKFMEDVQYDSTYVHDDQKSQSVSLPNQQKSMIPKTRAELPIKGYLSSSNCEFMGLAIGGSTAVASYLHQIIPTPDPSVLTAVSIIPSAAAAGMFATCAYSLYKNKRKSVSHDPRAVAEEKAMAMFQFDENDLEHPQRFNSQIIMKRYKRLAKHYHPDRKHGDRAIWLRLDVAQRILLSMADPEQFSFPYSDASKMYGNDDTLGMETRKAIEHPMQNKAQNKDSEVQGSSFSVGQLLKRARAFY